jgi:MauM/NapG family ferredoxin protein
MLGRSAAGLVLAVGCLALFRNLRGAAGAPSGARGSLGIVRPPGALDESAFLSRCIRCTRCAEACQARCIHLFGPEAGGLQGTPYILPSRRGCNLCLACGPACPTEALVPVDSREGVSIGVAVVDERLCVSHNGTGICGACHTVCPLRDKAITQDQHNAPVVHAESCTGCGLCEEACIVRDRRAIRVKTARNWQAT